MHIIAWHEILRFVSALVFVLALMGILTLTLRLIRDRYNLAPQSKKRLQVMETLQLDARRKAIILRRDNRQHLVILGPGAETVVESGIESVEDKPE